jgi:hypothetical protein
MRTRSLSLGTLAAAALIGCAPGSHVETIEPEGPPPMRVWIGYPIGSSSVVPLFVNREAHVAMFEIIPGRGVSMLYPRSSADVFASDAHYADLAFQLGRSLYESDPFGLASSQPRYYYAVASAEPLYLSRLLSSLSTMRRALGRMYASYRPYDVIDRLTLWVVPEQPDEDWATDLFVAWPVPSGVPAVLAEATPLRWIACANGRIISVPRDYPYYGCPGDTRAVAIAAKPPVKQLSADSVSRPRLPKIRDGQRTADVRGGDVERRRAEAGARRSNPRGVARAPSHGTESSRTDRYRDTRGSSARDGASSTASRDASASGGNGRSQAEERGEAGPVRTESGERKPRR